MIPGCRQTWVLSSTAILTGLLLVLVAAAEVPMPNSPLPAAGGDCVAPVEDMRRNHMDYLVHQRQDTVHRGVRTPRYSLVGCVDCHAQENERGEFVPVDGPGQFCQGCHAYAAVTVDCFQCHATKPADGAEATTSAATARVDSPYGSRVAEGVR